MRAVFILLFWLSSLLPAMGQDLSGLARIVPGESRLESSRNAVELTLALSQGVPYRVYTLADPDQLVIELSEVNWRGFDVARLSTRHAGPVQVGTLAPGWSGLVMDLGGPFALKSSALRNEAGSARLTVELGKVSREAFAAASGMPATSVALTRAPLAAPEPEGDIVVVIDPGHGGIDPGAERGGVVEADLMLLMARELRDGLRREGGINVHMTRDSDTFISLPARAAMARRLGADLFISLHADALPSGYAEGATVYTLAEEATDAASALLAERHNRVDLIAGIDLGGQGDEIAQVLLDLARTETTPRSERLSYALLDGLGDAGARLNSNPSRAADFAVLRSADVPSVLVEVGFLSSDRDRIELQSPEKRGRIIRGLVGGIMRWTETDREERALLRQ